MRSSDEVALPLYAVGTEFSQPRTNLDRYGYDINTSHSTGTHGLWHIHRGLEIIILHRGTALLNVNGAMEVLVPGDIAVFDATQNHAVRALNGLYTRTVLHVLPGTEAQLPFPATSPTRLMVFGSDSGIREAISHFILGSDKSSYALVTHGHPLVSSALSSFKALERPPKHAGLPAEVCAAIDTMLKHVVVPVNLDKLAQDCYVSHGHLCYLFKMYFGCSPKGFMGQIRVEHASNLLLKNMSINSVANAMAFSSRRGFEKLFCRVTGFAPGTYRDTVQPRLHTLGF